MTARGFTGLRGMAKVAGATMTTGGTPMAPSWRLPIRAALAGVLAANFAIAAQAADKVAVGTGGSASDAPFYIAYDKGFFKDEGLDVDLIVLDSGAKVIAPLGTGELDVGSGALSVGFWNALVRGIKFRIVADRGHAQPGYLYQTVFMRKDLIDSGKFKSLKDLKGMRMSFAAQGVTSLSLLNEAAKYAGIKFEDVTPVYLSFPQQIAALQNKALDGTLLIEPQATVAVNAGYGVRFLDTNEFYPYQQISVIFFSDKFATQRKDVAEKFMRAWLRGVRSYNDAIAATTMRSRTERSPASAPTRSLRPWRKAST
jgi:NitT/TauT family transport system substrate-binding protein